MHHGGESADAIRQSRRRTARLDVLTMAVVGLGMAVLGRDGSHIEEKNERD